MWRDCNSESIYVKRETCQNGDLRITEIRLRRETFAVPRIQFSSTCTEKKNPGTEKISAPLHFCYKEVSQYNVWLYVTHLSILKARCSLCYVCMDNIKTNTREVWCMYGAELSLLDRVWSSVWRTRLCACRSECRTSRGQVGNCRLIETDLRREICDKSRQPSKLVATGITQAAQAGRPRNHGSILWMEKLFRLRNADTGSQAYTNFYSMGNGGKAAVAVSYHSLSYNAEIKNEWRYTSIIPPAFVLCVES
jgi:hypothetical protein